MAKIGDVARRAGVSTATVSRALSNPDSVRPETRKLVLDAVRELGYTPNAAARNLRAGRSRMLLTVVPLLSNSFFARIVSGIDQEASRRGYGTIISEESPDSVEKQAHLLDLAAAGLFDGVLLLSALMPRVGRRSLADMGMPLVRVCSRREPGAGAVLLEEREATLIQTRHLLGLGHRRFMYISGGAGNINDIPRYEGFCEAIAEAGLQPDQQIRVEGFFDFASGTAAAHRFLELRAEGRAPTAIVAVGDQMAIACMKGIQEAGLRIPEDVSIVGFDGIDFTNYCQPTLTTIVQPAEDMGAAAAGLLIDMLQGERDPGEIVFPATLRVAGSTGPAPAG
ncbi:LacI family DNA-binding transcriptional regulator [Chthonobacter albigriseus]|uniref:LacI family DNA-binding transcriptional regulator n=1 Tax=Chthonobacter albigriseus TaxID=1683161 RepID=UPI0024576021|nr:LacI family DNA-binding transcriptional regulator [Chthonobacter albigriseus]